VRGGGWSVAGDAQKGGGRGARRREEGGASPPAHDGEELAARGGGRGPAAGSGMLGEDGREGKNGIKKL